MADVNRRNRLFLPVYVPALILSSCEGLLIPVFPLFAKSFGVSYGLVGLVLASDGIGQLLFGVPCTVIIRRFGRKTAMVAGVCLIVTSVGCLYATQTVTQVVLLRLVAGMGGALWNVSRHSYLTEVTSLSRRGRAIAVFGGVNRIGNLAGPAAGGALAVAFGLRAPFLTFAALGSLAALTVAVAVERSSSTPTDVLPRHPLFHLKATFVDHRRSFATAGSGQLFGQMIRSGRRIIVPLYAADIIGLGVQSIGWIVSISAFVDMLLFYPAGMIMDRYGRKFATVPCFLVQAVGMGLIPLTCSFSGIVAATVVVGLGNGIGSGTMMTLGADLAPEEARGEFLGVWRVIGDGGHMGGPLLVGAAADLAGLSASGWATSGVGFVAAAIFAFCVPETLRK